MIFWKEKNFTNAQKRFNSLLGKTGLIYYHTKKKP